MSPTMLYQPTPCFPLSFGSCVLAGRSGCSKTGSPRGLLTLSRWQGGTWFTSKPPAPPPRGHQMPGPDGTYSCGSSAWRDASPGSAWASPHSHTCPLSRRHTGWSESAWSWGWWACWTGCHSQAGTCTLPERQQGREGASELRVPPQTSPTLSPVCLH